MNKQDLLETYTLEELADKYLNLKSADDILINSRNNKIDELLAENKLLHNKLDRAKSDYEILVSRSTEKANEYIKRGSISLVDIVTRDDKFERYKVEKEVQKLNSIIDILLENFKGKSE